MNPLLFFPLLYFVFAQNPAGRFEEDLKGTLIKYIIDLPNSPSKTSYSLQTKDQGVVELVVDDPKFVVVQPGEEVRAPVTKLREGLYQLVNFMRPLYESEFMAVGSGGIDGSGLNLMRLKTDEFIHRVHDCVSSGARRRAMQTLATTERSLLVALINFRSKSLPQSTTINRVSSWVFDGPDSVDKLYNDCTRNQFRFLKQKSVMAPRIYTVNDPNDAQGTSQWLAEVASLATQAVRQDGLNPANYDHFVMILPSFSSRDNGASGLAPVGPGCGKPCNAFINVGTINEDGWATEVIAHELGHNLGWLHSGVPADGGFNVPRPRSSIESEYGDMSGVMGNGQPICPVLINQLSYKWITATEMISSSKLALLSPMGSPSANTLQGLIVLTQPTVYVSYRATVGPDERFRKVEQMGRGQWSDAVYVHVKKQEIGTTAIAKISVGQTFNQGSYSISFISQNGNVAQVCVSINGAPCSNSGGSGGSGGGPIRPCDNNPCGPNGECIPQVSSYVCQCKPGYVGSKCESNVCGSVVISGFSGTVAVLNGEWKRINDYAGKVAFSMNNMYFYFVPPSMWAIGPNLGGATYYAIAQTNTDSPQSITTWSYNQRTQIICGGGGGAPAGTDCVGQWTEWSQCSAQCNGFQSRTYKVIKAATGNGAICPSQDGQREQRGCGPTCAGAPINCVGNFWAVGQCNSNCMQTAEYKITQQAANGGAPCSYQNGATIQYKCSGGQCTGGPINCVGSFVGQSQCMQNCEFTAQYKITQQAANGGAPCPNRDGDIGRWKCTGGFCNSGVVNCAGSWVGQSQCMQNCEFTARFTITRPPANGGAPCNFREGDIGRWKCTGGYCQNALESGNAISIPNHKMDPSVIVIASACVISSGIVIASLLWKRRRQRNAQLEYVLM